MANTEEEAGSEDDGRGTKKRVQFLRKQSLQKRQTKDKEEEGRMQEGKGKTKPVSSGVMRHVHMHLCKKERAMERLWWYQSSRSKLSTFCQD